MSIHKLLVNTPIDMVANEAAIVPGKFGAQIRLKGSVDGDPNATVFLPGKVWAALKAFKIAGVVPMADYNEEPAEGTEVPLPLNASEFQLVYAKGASDKYANINVTVRPNGKTAAAALSPNAPRDYTPPQFRDDLPAELREQDEYETETVKTIQNGGTPKTPMRQAYKAITEWTLKEIAPLYEKAGIGLSPEAAAAISATIFINADKHGKFD